MAAGLLRKVNHPDELLKGLVGTGWNSDPAEALGELAPNAALTLEVVKPPVPIPEALVRKEPVPMKDLKKLEPEYHGKMIPVIQTESFILAWSSTWINEN